MADEYRKNPRNNELRTQGGPPPGTVYEDGSIAGGGVIEGSLADIGDGGFGIDFDANGGRGAIVW